MSYEIIYDRQFIKTSRGFIPMILSGSNNCTMYYGGREIRERSWWAPLRNANGEFEFTEEDFIDFIKSKNYTSDKEVGIKYHSRWLKESDLHKFWLNGIKSARTIEEIRNFNHGVSVDIAFRSNENKNESISYKYCSDTSEIELALDNFYEEISTNSPNGKINITISGTIEPLKGKAPIVKGKVIVKYKDFYISDFNEKRITETKNPYDAIAFNSKEEALEVLPKAFMKQYRFVKADSSSVFNPKTKDWAIKVVKLTSDGLPSGTETYVYSYRAGTIRFYSYADAVRKFNSEKEAESWLKKHCIRTAFGDKYQFVPVKI